MPEKIRSRKTTHKESLSDSIYRHSPIKRGVIIVKDEDKVLAKYNKIINRLYLGNYQAAKDKEFFKDKKIKAVLNCSKDIPSSFLANKDMEYMRIPIDDSLKDIDIEKAYLFMPAAVEFIHKHCAIQKQSVLVHCWAGRQRSGIMVAAYLVAKHGMTPKQACKYIIDRRPEAFHYGLSLNFEIALEKYYKGLQKCKKRSVRK